MPSRTPARHLLSITELTDEALHDLVARAAWYAEGHQSHPLAGRVVGTYFRKTSTRTRTAFSVATLHLGGQLVAFGPNDLQDNTGESDEDIANVLSSMLDALVARMPNSDSEIATFARQDRMSVVNAMSASEHPTQAITDLASLHYRFGRIDGLRVLYVGEGNNTAAALALALTRFDGTYLELRTPPGYGVAASVLDVAREQADRHGSTLGERHDLDDVPDDIDIVYTTRWQTTGTEKLTPDWRTVFAPFTVDQRLLDRAPKALFMHDLPAHRGEEVTSDVLDGPRSIAFEQAEFKLHGAKAVLEHCVAGISREC
jgi:ornithine carbamoyltransferase